MFKKATIMGVNSQVTGTIINPSDAYVIQAGDELVALTNNANAFIPDMVRFTVFFYLLMLKFTWGRCIQ